MSKQSSFGFTNNEASTQAINPIELDPVSKYARLIDDADHVRLSNKTAPIDQKELIDIRSQSTSSVNTAIAVQNPAPVKDAIRYTVKLDEVLRTVDGEGSNQLVIDNPITMNLTICHETSGNITSEVLEKVFLRLIGFFRRADGTYRFDDLMRGALEPVTD